MKTLETRSAELLTLTAEVIKSLQDINGLMVNNLFKETSLDFQGQVQKELENIAGKIGAIQCHAEGIVRAGV